MFSIDSPQEGNREISKIWILMKANAPNVKPSKRNQQMIAAIVGGRKQSNIPSHLDLRGIVLHLKRCTIILLPLNCLNIVPSMLLMFN